MIEKEIRFKPHEICLHLALCAFTPEQIVLLYSILVKLSNFLSGILRSQFDS